MLLLEHSTDIHTKVIVEKNRIRTEELLAGRTISEYDSLNAAVLTVFGNMEAAEIRVAVEEGRAALSRSDPRRAPFDKRDPNATKTKTKTKKSPFKRPTEFVKGKTRSAVS